MVRILRRLKKTRLRRPKVICTSVETFGTNYCIKFIVNTAAEGGDFFLLLYMAFSEILKILLILLLYMAPYILVRHCTSQNRASGDSRCLFCWDDRWRWSFVCNGQRGGASKSVEKTEEERRSLQNITNKLIIWANHLLDGHKTRSPESNENELFFVKFGKESKSNENELFDFQWLISIYFNTI